MKRKFELGQKIVWICKEPHVYKEINAKIISCRKDDYVALTQDNECMSDNGLYLVIDDSTEKFFYIPLASRIVDFFKLNECCVSKIGDCKMFEIETSTPAGEDWIFCIPYCQDFVELSIALHDAYKNFDIDENAELYILNREKNGVPKSIRTILEDQVWKKKKLERLYKESIKNMREKGDLYV